MQSADAARRVLAAALLIVGNSWAAEPQYGKVETFEPGKKYTCLPTADRKGWDCREAASKDAAVAAPDARPVPSEVPPSEPAPSASAAPIVAAPQAGSAKSSQPGADTATSSAPAARNSGLPPYLRAPRTGAPSAAQAAAPPEAQQQEPASAAKKKAAPEPDARAQQATAPPPQPAAAHEPANVEKNSVPPSPSQVADAPLPATAESTPAPAPSSASAPVAAVPEPAHATAGPAMPASSVGGGDSADFLALPGSAYIVELAHAANKSDLDALRASLHPARGQLYELHLLRDGADWWLLLWGTFDNVDAARAARSELPSDVPINAGWPRLVAPLQNEARHAAE